MLSIVPLFLSACDPSPPTSPFSAQQVQRRDLGFAADAGAELNWLPTLDGTWLHYSEVSTCVEIARSLEQINSSLYLVEVSDRPHGGLSERWTLCEVSLTPVLGQRARVPDALRESLSPLINERGLRIGDEEKAEYLSGPIVELWGARFDEPVSEAFVTGEDDPRIFDSDDDGERAATLLVGDACEVQLVQRRITQYQGLFSTPVVFVGGAWSVTEQLILEATQPLCETRYRLRSHPEGSRFIRRRVDGAGGALNLDKDGDGSISCEEVQGSLELLFQPREVDDLSCNVTP
ncbi:MAG: hypothetical protein VYD19_02960 [Myxococcota bacterium]|nr:hypothetical protein [Myxococcota bacterium]